MKVEDLKVDLKVEKKSNQSVGSQETKTLGARIGGSVASSTSQNVRDRREDLRHQRHDRLSGCIIQRKC